MKKNHTFFLSLACAACIIFPCGAIAQSTAAPDIQWQKLLGSTGTESQVCIRQTNDNGYILTIQTNGSNNGDISGTTHGSQDIWVVKLEATGSKVWDKLLGGSSGENPASIIQTTDGGYIILGQSGSSQSGDITGTTISPDLMKIWVVKLDASGNILWNILWGTTGQDFAHWLCQTSDGGYVFTGYSATSGGTETAAWVTKLNPTGTVAWTQNLVVNPTPVFYPKSVEQTADGGFIVSADNGGAWIGKLDASGNKVWEKTLKIGGGSTFNTLPTPDGGYILSCSSPFAGFGVSDITGITHGGYDIWIVKLDASGNKVWDKLYGGSGTEGNGQSNINTTSDGGYIVSTTSTSSASGDVTGTNNGGNDIWIFKIDADGNKVWDKLIGGSNNDWLNLAASSQVEETSDKGYIVAGESRSSNSGDVTGTNHGDYDAWVVKLLPTFATPVTMVNFTGTPSGNSILLQWTTVTEINNQGFTVQRSTDGKSFSAIGYRASLATDGSSSSPLRYSFEDPTPAAGTNYYRLKQVDIDGTSAQSNVVPINNTGISSTIQLYPNPATAVIYLANVPVGSSIQLIDLKGAVLKTVTVHNANCQIDVSNMPSGMYLVRIPDVLGKDVKTLKFVKR